jgi:hypothetical protein
MDVGTIEDDSHNTNTKYSGASICNTNGLATGNMARPSEGEGTSKAMVDVGWESRTKKKSVHSPTMGGPVVQAGKGQGRYERCQRDQLGGGPPAA